MPQSHVESKACSEAHVSEGAGQDMAWAPKLGSKAKEVNGEQAEDASTDGTAHEASSLLSARPFPPLADLRSQVDQQLQEACAMRSSWEVSTENSRLSHDLRAARSQLEEGEIEAAWQEEVEFWKEEVSRLEAEVLALRQRRAEAEEAKAQLKVGKESTVVALSGAEQQLAELESEQASCEAACEKAERQNAKLRHSLKQNSSLERGGAARLFVSALPALDAAAVEAARTALHAHMQKKLSGPKS